MGTVKYGRIAHTIIKDISLFPTQIALEKAIRDVIAKKFSKYSKVVQNDFFNRSTHNCMGANGGEYVYGIILKVSAIELIKEMHGVK